MLPFSPLFPTSCFRDMQGTEGFILMRAIKRVSVDRIQLLKAKLVLIKV